MLLCFCMSSTNEIGLTTNDQAKRIQALQQLRARRSRGRINDVNVAAHLRKLKKDGDVTSHEYDYVMGFSDTLEPEKKGEKK